MYIKSSTKIYSSGNISINKGTYFGNNTYVVANPESSCIKIGENCMISHDVHIRTAQYDISSIHGQIQDRKVIYGNIEIGNCVWIGKGVYIKGGVTIGANSVVTRNVSSNSVVGGIPARIIK